MSNSEAAPIGAALSRNSGEPLVGAKPQQTDHDS
jgi:hypothetical protein